MVETTFDQAYPIAVRAAKVRATAAVASGAIRMADREDIEQEGVTACWRALPKFDPGRASLRTFIEQVVARHITSLGVGVDLTRARYTIYFSLGFSLGSYEQSLARIHRPGQTRPVEYIHLLAEGTVDEKVMAALSSRADVVNSVLQQMKGGQ